MNLDREITILEPVKTLGATGQEVVTYQNFTTILAAFNPKMGRETYNDRMIRAETTQVFIIRQEEAPEISAEYLVKMDTQFFNIISVLEYTPRATTARGRYFALNTIWRDNEQSS